MSLEKWKTIDGYENYQVSTWGRVRNADTGKILKPEKNKKGYLRVDIYGKDGNRRHAKIHRLVAMAFVPNLYIKPQINHIDGNNQNNSYTNLEWVTDVENKAKRKELKELQRGL